MYLGYIKKVKIVAVLVHNRHLVNRQRHNRLVDARTEAAHIDGRGHTRTIIGLVVVGSKRRNLLERNYMPVLNIHPVYGGGRILPSLLLVNFYGRYNIHPLQHHSVGTLKERERKESDKQRYSVHCNKIVGLLFCKKDALRFSGCEVTKNSTHTQTLKS